MFAPPFSCDSITDRRRGQERNLVRKEVPPSEEDLSLIHISFDMRVLNNLDRFHLTMDVIHLLPEKLGTRGAFLIQQLQDKLVEHKQYIAEHGQDLPEIRDWKWNNGNGNYDA